MTVRLEFSNLKFCYKIFYLSYPIYWETNIIMLKKILSLGKKSDNFFLEIDEDQAGQETNSETAVATQPAPKEEAKAISVAGLTSKLTKKSTKKKGKSQDVAPETPVKNVVKTYRAVDSVEQLIVNAVSGKKQSEAETTGENTFATNYLIAKPASNRRPGPSLDKFKQMSRGMSIDKKQA